MRIYFWFLLFSVIFPSPLLGFTEHCDSGTGRCYWISDRTQGMWSQGRAACQSDGGDLAVMETEELYSYATNAIR